MLPFGSLAVSFETDPPWMVALRDALVVGEEADDVQDYHPERALLAIEAAVVEDYTFE